MRLIRHSLLKISAIMTLVILAATLASAQNATLQKISPQAGACATGPCVSTYHNDPMRDGVNSSETALKPSLFPSQSAANFGLLTPAAGGASGAVDGLIYAQPLYLSGVVTVSYTHLIASGHVYCAVGEASKVVMLPFTSRKYPRVFRTFSSML